ncbi:Calnexin like protein [Tritrichomonas foetus]|uniref:Calnexin like protein n=1 Tax=Tritrichomonas foetus TaxID=1144522 RepID=A0A1J4JQZ0_9EUKA|nr:Calnexin like protein [Tritrichomonas foetus]|eukprot:OHT01537.1 Calnexin like protein [Tritrichomonas foetus]
MFAIALFSTLIRAIPLKPEPLPFHFESFGDDTWTDQWQVTTLPNYTGQWEHRESKAPQSHPGEKMIFMSTENSYYGLSTKFPEPLDVTDKTLVVQYEIRFEDTIECGGAYIKLYSKENFDTPSTVSNETRYVIMFGPDKCGDTNKVHFIFRHLEPSGEWEEKHLEDPPLVKVDKVNHLYTLIVRPDNTFEVLIDGVSEKSGSLFDSFTPSVNPPKTIDDPTDHKPADWVDEEMMDDPDAEKPEDWDENEPEYIPDPEKLSPPEGWLTDEPRFIPDPEATQPDDWDIDIYGEWEPPTIANPKCESAPGCGEYEPPLIANENYRGKWEAPQIENPAYKGEWKPRQIPNPNYYEDPHPHNFPQMVGAGFELWMVNKDVGFSNIYIGTDEEAVKKWNAEHFQKKHHSQEEEMKRLEPEPTPDNSYNPDNNDNQSPGRKLHTSGEGFEGALKDFALNLKDAWDNLYRENQYAAIGFVAVLCSLPLFFAVTCGSSEPKKRKLTPEEIKRRQMLRAKKEARRKKREERLRKKKEAEEKKKQEEEEDNKEEANDEQ